MGLGTVTHYKTLLRPWYLSKVVEENQDGSEDIVTLDLSRDELDDLGESVSELQSVIRGLDIS